MKPTTIGAKERYAELRRLWMEGFSAEEIANLMGYEVQSVKNLASKLGLPRRLEHHNESRRRAIVNSLHSRDLLKARRLLLRQLEVERGGPLIPPRPIFLGAPPKTCQFPMREYRYGDPDPFCGAKSEEGKPYCAEHMALCYTPPESPRTAPSSAELASQARAYVIADRHLPGYGRWRGGVV